MLEKSRNDCTWGWNGSSGWFVLCESSVLPHNPVLSCR